MPKFLISLFTELASVIGGGVAGSLNLVVNIMQKGFGAAMQFHQEGIALARDLGLSASQAQAYTQALTESTAKLANKYGVTADAIKAVQRGISESTGRQLLLNDAQREQLVIADKLVGAQTRNQFTAEIMNHLGGQVSTVEGAISKAYATASKQGLNAQKFSATVAKNLSMANKLSFRDGVNGIIRMTALSEKLGFNLQLVEAAANKFMDLESAIESSAQLQMLGGAAGAFGGNPLEMAYEANYDPEAFTKRMTKMLGGYAQFDTKTGMANVNGINRDFVKNIAQAMGISMDEAMTIAKKNAEVKFKENQFSTQLTNRFGNDEAIKNYILNNSTYNTETKRLELNGRDISEYKDEEIAELKRMGSMSDHDLMVEQAQALTSLPEQINGAAAKVAASFAEGIEHYIPHLREEVKKIGDFLGGHAKNWGQSVGQALAATFNWLSENGPVIADVTKKVFTAIDKVISLIGPIAKWVLENPWPSLFAFIAARGIYGAASNTLRGITSTSGSVGGAASGGIGGSGSVLNGLSKIGKGAFSVVKSVVNLQVKFIKLNITMLKNAFSAIRKVFGIAINGITKSWNFIVDSGKKLIASQKAFSNTLKSATNEFKSIVANAKRSFKNTLNQGGSRGKAIGNASKNIWKNLKGSGAIKTLGKRVGVAAGGGLLGMAGNYLTDELVERGAIKKGGFGHYASKMASTAAEYAALGSMLGPIGTALGGAVGAVKGAYDTWKTLPENADKDFLDYAISVGNSIAEGGKEAFSWAKEKIGPALSSINKEIQERGGYLNVAFNYITTPIRLFINAIEGIGKLILHPIDTIKNAWDGLKNWWNSDNKLERLWNAAKNTVMGEKHADGGIVGAKPKSVLIENDGVAKNKYIEKHAVGGIVGGNSYSGDRVLTGLNSGEMVLNKNQQAALFNFINEMPSILSKIGTNGNVSYYTARNYGNSNITDRSSQMSYGTSNYNNRNITDRSSQMSYDASNLVSRVLNSTVNTSKTESNNTYNNSSTVGGNVSYYTARNYGNSNITNKSLQMSYDTSNLVSRVLNSITNSSKTESNNTFNGIQTDLFRSLGSIISSIMSPLSVLKNSNDAKAKPAGGNSYSGDRILTSINSGEMALNKNQQAELPKIGTDGNVSYYNARNYSNSSTTDRSLQMSYDTSNYNARNYKNSNIADKSLQMSYGTSNLVSRVLNSITNRNITDRSLQMSYDTSNYNARNYKNSNIADKSLQMSYGTSNLVSRVLNSITNRNITDRSSQMSYDTSNLVSRVLNSITNSSNSENNTYNNSSIRQKHNALHSNIVGRNVSSTFNGVQTDLFRSIGNIFSSIISPFSTLKNSNDVKAKPVGEREYIYKPNDIKINGAAEITVKDVNVNINGTIKLDAGNLTKNIDVRQLLGDSSFLSSLKDIIKESINNDMNGGRFMNDNATLRGSLTNTTYWGR